MQLEHPPQDLAFCLLMENRCSFRNRSVINFGVGFELHAWIGAAQGEVVMGAATMRGRRARGPIRSRGAAGRSQPRPDVHAANFGASATPVLRDSTVVSKIPSELGRRAEGWVAPSSLDGVGGVTGDEAASPGTDAARPVVSESQAMEIALAEAALAPAHGDVPVGAVVLDAEGRVLARRHNERELAGDPTAHAELLALRDAAAGFVGWRLLGTRVVSTLEPCPMCAGALVAARVARVVYAASDPKAGACGSLMNLCSDPRLNHSVEVVSGVMGEEASAQLRAFFAERRSR